MLRVLYKGLRQELLPGQLPAGGVGWAELWVLEGSHGRMLLPTGFHEAWAVLWVPSVVCCVRAAAEGCCLLGSAFTEVGVSLGQHQQVTASGALFWAGQCCGPC